MYTALVTGDFHIAEKFGLEQITRLLNVVATEANKRDELIILGDVFHSCKVSPRELSLFIGFLKQVHVPIVLISGNHDMSAEDSILDFLPQVFNLTYSKSTLRLSRDGLSMLLGHFDVAESVLGAYDFRLCSGVAADSLEVPLALLGHIHKSQNIQTEKTQVVHPGSLFYIDFAERLDKKALVSLTVDGGAYKVDRVPLSPDPIVQLEITPETPGTILQAVPKNSRVKLVVHYSDLSLEKKQVIKKFDAYMFKEKKFVFVYESTKVQDTLKPNKLLENLDLYLKEHAKAEVAELILRMVNQ